MMKSKKSSFITLRSSAGLIRHTGQAGSKKRQREDNPFDTDKVTKFLTVL